MSDKISAGKTSDIAEGSSKVINANGVEIAVFNVGGNFYAILNECAHQAGPLGEGFVSGETVTCPIHAWQFDLKTGKGDQGIDTRVFKTTVENGEVYVEV